MIGSIAFAGLTVVTDRQTDRPLYSVCSNKLHLAYAAIRPGNHNNVSVGGAVIVTGSVKTTETERRVAFQVRSEKMAKHLEIMNKRYNELERRRNLEVEGFKTDIRQLRGRLKDVEKQLYKVRRRQLFSSA